jgi:3'(2'),5'-bisphosphate nucleotidase
LPDDSKLLEMMAAAALEAGRIALRIYHGDDFQVRQKADQSPVTQADQASEAYILKELARVAERVPVVAEEATAAGKAPVTGREFFLVDPLDGTKEFIARNGEFTINIALIRDTRPVLGVVYAPVSGTLYLGNALTHEALRSRRVGESPGLLSQGPRERIHVREVPQRGVTAVVSRSHSNPATEAYLAHFPIAERVSIGSSLKLCLVAAGEADVYPRIEGRTMEWDIAAGHAVLAAAGGSVRTSAGDLSYGKPDLANGSFVAVGPLAPWPVPA